MDIHSSGVSERPWVWLAVGPAILSDASAEPWSERWTNRLTALGGSIDEASGLVRFSDPPEAVSFALELQKEGPRGLDAGAGGDQAGLRERGGGVGICSSTESADGLFARALSALADRSQILTTRQVFDVARLGLPTRGEAEAVLIEEESAETVPAEDVLVWLAHGLYRWSNELEAFEDLTFKVFEVGVQGLGILEAPESSVAARNWVVPSRDSVLGWRPAAGRSVPGKPSFRLEKLLGQGGFGEVWSARQPDRPDAMPRVFKFCFEAKQVLALQREVTFFRRLQEELGDRDDITRIVDWSFDSVPCFIETEYSSGGDLAAWAEAQGGLGAVSFERRLDLVCQVADALAAAHSVGVLHKDVKPENVLIHERPAEGSTDEPDGSPSNPRQVIQTRLTDFGIAQLASELILGTELRSSRSGVAAVHSDSVSTEAVGEPADETDLGRAATRIYEAPELVEGRRPTVQADVYALGVVFYQMVIGDLARPMASGWQRDVEDELLREVIADACHVRPDRRMASAAELASRIRGLDEERRRRALKVEEEQQRELLLAQVETWKRRRRLFARTAAILVIFTLIMWGLGRRIEREVERVDQELATANAVSRFLVELFEGADADDNLSTVQLLDRGVRRARSELAEQPALQARLLGTVGLVQARLGIYAQAQEVLEEALAIRRRQLGDDHVSTARSLHHAAAVHVIVGDVERAERYFRQCIQIFERTLGPDAAELAEPLERLANIEGRLNRPAEAEALYLRAIDILERSPGKEAHLGLTLANTARIYERTGRPYEAIDFLRRARALHEQHLAADHPALGQLYAVLGDTYSKIGLWEEAEPVLLRAQQIFEPRLGRDHPYLAAILSALGRVYLKRGDLDAAEQALRRTIELVEPVMGKDNLFLMSPLLSLAETLSAQGEHGEAARVYGRASALAEHHLAADDPRIEELRVLRQAALAARDRAP